MSKRRGAEPAGYDFSGLDIVPAGLRSTYVPPEDGMSSLDIAVSRIQNEPQPRNSRIFIPPADPKKEEKPGSLVEPPKIREQYVPPNKVYIEKDLERMLDAGFQAKAYTQQVNERVKVLNSKRHAEPEAVRKLGYLDQMLDELYATQGLFHNLRNFADLGAVKYRRHVPELYQELATIGKDIKAYRESRESAVRLILSSYQQLVILKKGRNP